MPCELAQLGDEVGRGFGGVVRMDADDREDLRMFLGERDCAAAAFHGGADAEDAGDAGGSGAGEDVVEVGGEVGEIEVGVGVGEHVADWWQVGLFLNLNRNLNLLRPSPTTPVSPSDQNYQPPLFLTTG